MKMRMKKQWNKKRVIRVIGLLLFLFLVMKGGDVHAAPAVLESETTPVYESADTDSSAVGNLIRGNTFELNEKVSAENGSAWYRVTLSNGLTGYIPGSASVKERAADERKLEENAVNEESSEAQNANGSAAGNEANRENENAVGNEANRANGNAAGNEGNRENGSASGNEADRANGSTVGNEADREIGNTAGNDAENETGNNADGTHGNAAGNDAENETGNAEEDDTAVSDDSTAEGDGEEAVSIAENLDHTLPKTYDAQRSGNRIRVKEIENSVSEQPSVSKETKKQGSGLDRAAAGAVLIGICSVFMIRFCYRRLRSVLCGNGEGEKKSWLEKRKGKKRKKPKQIRKKPAGKEAMREAAKEEKKWKNSNLQK